MYKANSGRLIRHVGFADGKIPRTLSIIPDTTLDPNSAVELSVLTDTAGLQQLLVKDSKTKALLQTIDVL